jgi:hypothetical protein
VKFHKKKKKSFFCFFSTFFSVFFPKFVRRKGKFGYFFFLKKSFFFLFLKSYFFQKKHYFFFAILALGRTNFLVFLGFFEKKKIEKKKTQKNTFLQKHVFFVRWLSLTVAHRRCTWALFSLFLPLRRTKTQKNTLF